MKYIFFGTPRFAEIVLGGLLDAGMPPVALVCNPDRPVGRKKTITPPPTKVLALERSADIDIIQPEKIDETFLQRLRALEPDFFVVAAYAKILPKSLLDIPRLGTLGTHPSLLPKYRGASPIQSAILAGETAETGATIYLMDEKTDHGPILVQDKLSGASESIMYLELEEKLAKLSAQLLIKTIPNFFTGKTTSRTQDGSLATYTKKFVTQDGFVAPEELAEAEQNGSHAIEILHKINALNPEPGAWTTSQDSKRLKLLEAKIQDGKLILTKTQREGERPISLPS